MSRSFSSPDFNRSFPAEGPGHGAPWSSCTSPSPPATEIQEENLAAIPCPGLVGAQGTHRIHAGEGTTPQIPWNPLCFPARVTLRTRGTPWMRRDRSLWE